MSDSKPKDFHGIYEPNQDVPYILESIERVAKEKEEEMHPDNFELHDLSLFCVMLLIQVEPYEQLHEDPKSNDFVPIDHEMKSQVYRWVC